MTDILPCPTEDSDNCYWNAATMGNGQGQSFVNIDGVTTYCQPGELLAEDLSCVSPTFYAPEVITEAPVETYTETVQVMPEVMPETLAATGLDDISPAALAVGMALLIAGVALKLKGRRA